MIDMYNHATGGSWRVEGETEVDPFEIANLLYIEEDTCIIEEVFSFLPLPFLPSFIYSI